MTVSRSALIVCVLIAFTFRGEAYTGADPSGDVLRPDRGRTIRFFLGLDAGLNYSHYLGHHTVQITNPLNASTVLWVPFESGNGLGFRINAVADFPINRQFGIVGKLGYIRRTDNFTSTHENPIFYLDPVTRYPAPAMLDNTMDWSVGYMGFDLLLRYQISPGSLYVLGGVTYSSLVANSVDIVQTVMSPPGVSYPQAGGAQSGFNRISVSGSIESIEKTRFGVAVGVGTWIQVGKKMFLTPELTFDYPLTKLDEAPGVPLLFVPSSDRSFLTVTLTMGLRFGM